MTIDYSKLKVEDIKRLLLQEERYTEDEIKQMDVKGKNGWVALHKGDIVPEDSNIEEELGVLFEDVEEMGLDLPTASIPDELQEKEKFTRYNDTEWNDYVMSLFDPKELVDGKYPNVNGLRRLVGLLLGDIVFSGPIKSEVTLDPNHTGKAVVTYEIIIDWKLDAFFDGIDIMTGYPQRKFSSIASAWIGNTDDMYAVFPECIAETRAESRTLRRALRISTVTADELTKKDTAAVVQQQKESVTTTGEWESESFITEQQINTIKTMCNRLGIDVFKFINSGSKQYDEITKITRASAAGMLTQLNRYQSSGDKPIEVPLNLMGD